MAHIVAALLSLVATVASAEPSLIGTWKSDSEQSSAFNRQYARLEERTHLFLEQMLGRATLAFTQTYVRSEMPDWESTTAEGNRSLLKGFNAQHRYRVLSTTASQVVIETRQAVTGDRAVLTYNFASPDTVWLYLAGPGFENLHAREYFVRVGPAPREAK